MKNIVLKNFAKFTCVGASFLISLHALGLQLYQKKRLRYRCVQLCVLILQIQIKLLKTKFLIDGFTCSKVSYTNHNAW